MLLSHQGAVRPPFFALQPTHSVRPISLQKPWPMTGLVTGCVRLRVLFVFIATLYFTLRLNTGKGLNKVLE